METVNLGAGQWRLWILARLFNGFVKLIIEGGTDKNGSYQLPMEGFRQVDYPDEYGPYEIFVNASANWSFRMEDQTASGSYYRMTALTEISRLTDSANTIKEIKILSNSAWSTDWRGVYVHAVRELTSSTATGDSTITTGGGTVGSWMCLSIVNTEGALLRYIIFADSDGVVRKHPISDIVYLELTERFPDKATCINTDQASLDAYPTSYEITLDSLNQFPFVAVAGVGGTEIYVGPERIPFPKSLLPSMVPSPVYPTPAGQPGIPSTSAYGWQKQPPMPELSISDKIQSWIKGNLLLLGGIAAGYWFFVIKKGKLK